MKVYSVTGEEEETAGYYFGDVSSTWLQKLRSRVANNLPLAPLWKSFDVEIQDAKGACLVHQFGPVSLGPYFAVHPSALKIEHIGSLLREQGELLPFNTHAGEAYIFNPRKFLGCLDENKTDYDIIKLKQEGKRITNRPVFNIKKLPSSSVFFRIPENWPKIYLAEPAAGGFKALYESLSLRGLRFIEQPITTP